MGSAIARGEQRVLNSMRSSLDKRTRVLFINSALLGGADTWIHLLLLRNLSQNRFELHAAGQTCPRCGTVIQPGQDARLRADRQWIHEACPIDP